MEKAYLTIVSQSPGRIGGSGYLEGCERLDMKSGSVRAEQTKMINIEPCRLPNQEGGGCADSTQKVFRKRLYQFNAHLDIGSDRENINNVMSFEVSTSTRRIWFELAGS